MNDSDTYLYLQISGRTSESEDQLEDSILSGSIPNQSDASPNAFTFTASTPLIKANRNKVSLHSQLVNITF